MTFEGVKESNKLSASVGHQLDKSKSPYMLEKTLKIIRMVCERGHPDFKKQMQSSVEKLRTCAQFRGKQDPVHGDSMNQRVRIEATFAAASKAEKTKDITEIKAENFSVGVTPQKTFTTSAPEQDQPALQQQPAGAQPALQPADNPAAQLRPLLQPLAPAKPPQQPPPPQQQPDSDTVTLNQSRQIKSANRRTLKLGSNMSQLFPPFAMFLVSLLYLGGCSGSTMSKLTGDFSGLWYWWNDTKTLSACLAKCEATPSCGVVQWCSPTYCSSPPCGWAYNLDDTYPDNTFGEISIYVKVGNPEHPTYYNITRTEITNKTSHFGCPLCGSTHYTQLTELTLPVPSSKLPVAHLGLAAGAAWSKDQPQVDVRLAYKSIEGHFETNATLSLSKGGVECGRCDHFMWNTTIDPPTPWESANVTFTFRPKTMGSALYMSFVNFTVSTTRALCCSYLGGYYSNFGDSQLNTMCFDGLKNPYCPRLPNLTAWYSDYRPGCHMCNLNHAVVN
eukprot:TRINITY_DN67757_c3_g8_i1.p1 TRINITY_DN67757_c3_g8~~TRINITY_DN67757_c3_g8_i1.p1  ORF type:complete len:549 (-),score=4.01 TRINITY_DN67757_c3_g8_i1:128-1636(-)